MASLITSGVSASSRRKLIEIAKAHARASFAEDEAIGSAEGKAFEAIQARPRARFLAELDKHPDSKAFRAEVGAAGTKLREIMGLSLSGDALQRKITDLLKRLDEAAREHRPTLYAVGKRSIRRETYLPAIARAVANRGRLKLWEHRFHGFRMRFRPEWADFIVPILRPPIQTSFVIEPPFDPDASVAVPFGLAVGMTAPPFATASGSLWANAGAFVAGYASSRAQAGAFLTIPAGFSTLKLQARITKVDALALAMSVGIEWASTGGIAEVTSLADDAVTRREDSINYVIASLIPYVMDEFQGTHVLNAEFPISRHGGEFMVNAGLKCDAWSAGLGMAVATAGGFVSKITVQLT